MYNFRKKVHTKWAPLVKINGLRLTCVRNAGKPPATAFSPNQTLFFDKAFELAQIHKVAEMHAKEVWTDKSLTIIFEVKEYILYWKIEIHKFLQHWFSDTHPVSPLAPAHTEVGSQHNYDYTIHLPEDECANGNLFGCQPLVREVQWAGDADEKLHESPVTAQKIFKSGQTETDSFKKVKS